MLACVVDVAAGDGHSLALDKDGDGAVSAEELAEGEAELVCGSPNFEILQWLLVAVDGGVTMAGASLDMEPLKSVRSNATTGLDAVSSPVLLSPKNEAAYIGINRASASARDTVGSQVSNRAADSVALSLGGAAPPARSA